MSATKVACLTSGGIPKGGLAACVPQQGQQIRWTAVPGADGEHFPLQYAHLADPSALSLLPATAQTGVQVPVAPHASWGGTDMPSAPNPSSKKDSTMPPMAQPTVPQVKCMPSPAVPPDHATKMLMMQQYSSMLPTFTSMVASAAAAGAMAAVHQANSSSGSMSPEGQANFNSAAHSAAMLAASKAAELFPAMCSWMSTDTSALMPALVPAAQGAARRVSEGTKATSHTTVPVSGAATGRIKPAQQTATTHQATSHQSTMNELIGCQSGDFDAPVNSAAQLASALFGQGSAPQTADRAVLENEQRLLRSMQTYAHKVGEQGRSILRQSLLDIAHRYNTSESLGQPDMGYSAGGAAVAAAADAEALGSATRTNGTTKTNGTSLPTTTQKIKRDSMSNAPMRAALCKTTNSNRVQEQPEVSPRRGKRTKRTLEPKGHDGSDKDGPQQPCLQMRRCSGNSIRSASAAVPTRRQSQCHGDDCGLDGAYPFAGQGVSSMLGFPLERSFGTVGSALSGAEEDLQSDLGAPIMENSRATTAGAKNEMTLSKFIDDDLDMDLEMENNLGFATSSMPDGLASLWQDEDPSLS